MPFGGGTFTYTPDADFVGADSFTYTATDGNGAIETGTVSVTITPVDDVVDDDFTTTEDTPITGNVDTNDTFSAPATFVVHDDAAHGSLIHLGGGSFTYTPEGDYVGNDSFTYTATDVHGVTETGLVTMEVLPADDVVDDLFTTEEDTAVTGDVSTNDTFSAAATFVIAADANHGTVIDDGDGVFTYTPDGDFVGTDTFTYTATDAGGASETGTVTITVTPVDDVIDDAVITEEDTAVSGDVSTNDTFAAVVTFVIPNDAAHGTVTDDGGGTFTYTPRFDFVGTDSFTYTATDVNGQTETGTVSVTVTPVADVVNDAVTTIEDTSSSGDVSANDLFLADATFVVHNDAVHGTVSDEGNGGFAYTPAADFNGTDSFTYTATDVYGQTETGTVSVTVTPVADVIDDAITTIEDTPVSGDVTTNDTFAASATFVIHDDAVHGSVTDDGSGTFTYSPPADFVGTDSFTYTATDVNGSIETGVVSVTVTPVDDVVDDTITTLEDTSATGNVSTNDLFLADATFVIHDDAIHGSVTDDGNGVFTYSPHADFVGTDSFTYIATDGNSINETGTVTVTVTPVEDVVDDAINTLEDTPFSGDVSTNDLFLAAATFVIHDDAVHGSVTDNGNGAFTYTPSDDFNGTDTFSYTATDVNGDTETGTVAVTVTPVDDVVGDALTTAEDTPVSGDVSTNDLFSAAAGFVVLGDASHGTLTDDGNGAFTYTPSFDFFGNDSFTYTATDVNGDTETGTVTVTVTPVDDVVDDALTTAEDTPVSGDVSTNDLFSAAAGFVVLGDAAHGTLTDDGNGAFTYTPSPEFFGTDSFTYTATDVNGDTETGTVTVTVTPVDDVVDDALTTAEDTPVSGDVSTNDLFLAAATFVIHNDAVHGSVTDDDDGTFTFTPDGDFVGTDSFTYTATDVNGQTETGTVTVTVTPVADVVDDTVTTAEDTPVSGDVSTNDLFSATATFVVHGDATHGSVTDDGNGSFTYAPAADYHGTDSFTYTATDVHGGIETGTVMLTVTPIDDVVDDAFTTGEDTPVTADVTTNDTFAATATFTVHSDADHGTVTNHGDGTFTYTPNADYSGTDSLTYTATDIHGHSESGTISITVTPASDVFDDGFTTVEDTPITADVTTNDTYSAASTFVIHDDATHGTVTDDGSGTFTYSPDADYHGADSFTYTATDVHGGIETGTVTLTVTPVADVVDDASSTAEDTPVTGDVTTNDLFLASATFMIHNDAVHGLVTDDGNGSFTYSPHADFVGTDSFTYTATDVNGQTETGTVTVTVTPVADVVDDTVTTGEDTPVSGDVSTNDLFSATATFVVHGDATHGSVTDDGNGTFTYTPDGDFVGADAFTYTATDAYGQSETGTVSVTITPVADVVDDAITTNEDTPASGDVSTNDTFAAAASFVIHEDSAFGTVSDDGDGSFTYTPAADYHGTDSFTYTATDAQGNSETGTVNVTVTPIDDVVDDAFTTPQDTPVTGDVSPNDLFTGPVTFAVLNDAASGSVVDISGGSFTYTPAGGFVGDDTFTYTATDAFGQIETGTVSIEVTPDHTGGVCYPLMNFDRAADGSVNTGGQIATDLYADWGVTITSSSPSHPPMLFDSASPTGGDSDLGAPGSDFGGPGVGSGGLSGSVGENAVDLGMILILSEDGDASDPDDNAGGGTLVFEFDSPATVDSIGLLDIDDTSNVVHLYDADDNLLASVNAANVGNNGFQRLTLGVDNVSRMEIVFVGSGAVTDLQFCTDHASPVTYSLPATIDEASSVTLNLTSTETITQWFVDWGDGTHETITDGSTSATHLYDDGNEQHDVHFWSETATGIYAADTTVTVNNIDPVLTISVPALGSPAIVDQDDTFDLNLSEFDPGEDTIYAWQIHWGDGSPTQWVDGNPASVPHVYSQTGTHTVTAKAFDEDSPHNGSFTEQSGRIIVEAENFTGSVAGTGNAAGHDWDLQSDSDVSGGQYLIAAPNTGRNVGDDTRGPRRDYSVSVAAAGTFYVWIRTLGSSGSNDSVHIGTGGVPATYGKYGMGNSSGNWTWVNKVWNRPGDDRVKVTFDSSGVHTLNLWMREDGTAIDKIFLTRSESDSPDGLSDAETFSGATGGYDSNSVDITVLGVNQAPEADDDYYGVDEDETLTIPAVDGVLDNDSDPEGATLTATILTQPDHGTVTLAADGSFVYTPDPDFDEIDTFTYAASDGDRSATATVTIHVCGFNDAPMAVNDAYETDEDTPITIDEPGVLVNDVDVEDDHLDATLMAPPLHGDVDFDEHGSFTYTPDEDYHGTDQFTYRLFDGEDYSGVATVSLTIHAVNDIPVAIDDGYVTDAGVTLNIDTAEGLLWNDYDNDGDTITIDSTTALLPSSAGTITTNPDGSFDFTPATGFDGQVTLDYTITDGTATSLPGTLTITVTSAQEFAKFYVADHSRHEIFKYDDGGDLTDRWDYTTSNRARGATSNAAGDTLWTVTAGHDVVVYTPDGTQIGKWQARKTGNSSGNLNAAEGVATDGTDIWIVDRAKDQVLFYAGGASHTSGNINATSKFNLHSSNHKPSGITTDGTNLYVLNDKNHSPRVFVYSLSGQHLGNWKLGVGGGNHDLQGITTNPTVNPDGTTSTELWVVDKKTDRVYYFPYGTTYRSGQHHTCNTFDLHADNRTPYGIADPPPIDFTPTITWTSAAGGDWDDTSNWDLGRVPNATDNVLIDIPGGDFEITVASSIGQFGQPLPGSEASRLYAYDPIVIGNARSLSLSGESEIVDLQIAGGTLKSDADLSISDSLTWASGTLSGTGTTTVAVSLDVPSVFTGNHYLKTNHLIVDGDANIDRRIVAVDAPTLELRGNTTITGSSFSFSGGSDDSNSSANTFPTATLINSGVLQVSLTASNDTFNTDANFSNTGALEILGGQFNTRADFTNAGTLDIGAGTRLTIHGVDTNGQGPPAVENQIILSPGGQITGDGDFWITGGDVDFDNPFSATGEFRLAGGEVLIDQPRSFVSIVLDGGTLRNDSEVIFTGAVRIEGASTLIGTGTTTLQGELTVNNSTSSAMLIEDHRLNIDGNTHWIGGRIDIIGDSTITNRGVFSITGTGGIQPLGFTGSSPSVFPPSSGAHFINHGTVDHAGPNLFSIHIPLENHNDVQIASGKTLYLGSAENTIQTAGQFNLGGGILKLAEEYHGGTLDSLYAFLDIQGGELVANGQIMGSLTNQSQLHFGIQGGSLVVDGDFIQTTTGTTLFRLDSPTDYGNIDVEQVVQVDGQLLLDRQYNSNVGDQFTLIDNADTDYHEPWNHFDPDPIIGTFTDKEEWAPWTHEDEVFRLTYLGDSGNDLILNHTGPGIKVHDLRKNEGHYGETIFSVPVTLDHSVPWEVTVNYTTQDSTALAGQHYTATSGTLVFAAGQTEATIDVPVATDFVTDETRQFFVQLSSAVEGTLFDDRALVNIVNDDYSEIPDNRGVDFWLAVPENWVSSAQITEDIEANNELGAQMDPDNFVPTPITHGFFVVISSEVGTSGVISAPSVEFEETFTVGAGESITVRLPDELEPFGDYENTGLFDLSETRMPGFTDRVTGHAIRVQSEEEIAVYGMAVQSNTTDGYMALPADVLGTRHILTSQELFNPRYVSPNPPNTSIGSQFQIVAATDGTEVHITPTAEFARGDLLPDTSNPGGSAGPHDPERPNIAAGETYTVLLDKGEVYSLTLRADIDGTDFTGTLIESSDPVAVWSGNTCANVPEDFGTCDILVEQIPPVNTWGSDFIINPLESRNVDRLRVVASEGRHDRRCGWTGPFTRGG